MEEPVFFDVFSLEMPSGVYSPDSGQYSIPVSNYFSDVISSNEDPSPGTDEITSSAELNRLQSTQFAYPIIHERNNVYGFDIDLSAYPGAPNFSNTENTPSIDDINLSNNYSTQQQYYTIAAYDTFFPFSTKQDLNDQFLPALPNTNNLGQEIKYPPYETLFQQQRPLQQLENSDKAKYKKKNNTRLKPGQISSTEEATEIFNCPHEGCTKVFNRQFNLKSHLKLHAPEKTFLCEQCPASFRRSHDLKRHCRSLHSAIKPFECKNCSKSFSRMDALRRHVGRPNNACFQP
ncbi:Metallothionein expression activator [Clydaea vesicula]|uniref:Metallothionein expression activator n=1 Tax=Clydaea vesicula TaxID=447962 RepID=A0AAD5TXB7_9FUNG|nr:Metallothionein expression activator [Clydaea vesicula]